jgi:pilus assembly protein Flp/PilA
MTKLKHFLKDESGATAIEYGLIAAGIAVALITVIATMGGSISNAFSRISSSITSATD